MNRIVLLGLVAFAASAAAVAYEPPAPIQQSNRNLDVQFVEQRLDNFDLQNPTTFQTAFYENDEFFATDGPLFVYIGGEWTAQPSTLRGGHIFDMARQFNGSLLYPEHRFYGQSIPGDLTVANLRYLTVEQALADLANFIAHVRRQPRYARSSVVLVGASYSATMAVWFRQMYPHLTVGAWASSAPIHAQVDFYEYKEAVGDGMRDVGGSACDARLAGAFWQAEQLIAAGQLDEFRSLFGLCDDFGSHRLDVAHAFSELSEILAGIVQSHRDERIEGVCAELLQNEGDQDHLAAFGRFVRGRLNGRCTDNYAEYVQRMRNATLGSSASGSSRQWLYQTCTEFGWFQTSTSPSQPFGSSFPIDLFYAYCTDIFGYQFNRWSIQEVVARTNVVFGSWQLSVRNVYFTNGSVDPWRPMGVQADLNESSPADVIPGAAHCRDLSSVAPGDSAELLAVRERITGLVGDWLAQ